MNARVTMHVAAAAFVVVAGLAMGSTSSAWAGGMHGGGVFRGGGGRGGVHGPAGGGLRFGAYRGLPPMSGVIHERAGMRPYLSAYGHTATEQRPTGFARAGFGVYGHVGTALPSYAFARPGYGFRREARFDRGLGYRERLRSDASRTRFVGGLGGGYGDGFGGYGDDRLAGPSGGVYTSGANGADGTYGGVATAAGPGTYDGGYASEAPLAARFAEPPLAPSPGAPYDPADRYAYAAAADVGPGPRVISLGHAARPGCRCGPHARVAPMIYRYGVGTAY